MIGAARSASVSTVYNNSRISDSCLQSRGWACIDFAPGITGTMCVLCARVIQSSAPKTNIYITFLQSCSRPSIAPTHARSSDYSIKTAQCTCPPQELNGQRRHLTAALAHQRMHLSANDQLARRGLAQRAQEPPREPVNDRTSA